MMPSLTHTSPCSVGMIIRGPQVLHTPYIQGSFCLRVRVSNTQLCIFRVPRMDHNTTVKLFTPSFSLWYMLLNTCVCMCVYMCAGICTHMYTHVPGGRKRELEGNRNPSMQLTCGYGGTPRFCLRVHPAEVHTYFLLSVLCPKLHQNPQSRLRRNRKENGSHRTNRSECVTVPDWQTQR